MSGYTGAGPGAGMAGGVGASPMMDASGAVSPFAQVGSRFPQFGLQGQGGAGASMGVNPNIQKQAGGFGISPQLLAQIAALQSRSPQFRPQAMPMSFTPGQSNGQIVNPYQTIDGRGSR